MRVTTGQGLKREFLNMLQTETFQMKEACEETGLSYETLKYYCNEALVPNHSRDKNNYRVFDKKDIAWIKGLIKLRDCGMSIKEMKKYMELCFEGEPSINKRKEMLEDTKGKLELEIERIEASLDYISDKQQFYDDVLEGKIDYISNLTSNN